jgi:hypothetical protein
MSFLTNGEEEGKTGPVWGLVPVGWGRYKEGCTKVSMVEMLCTYYEYGK